jgi:hypothetical protein
MPVAWGDTAVMLLLAITLDFDVNAWMPPDERVNACDLPNMFHPLQFRRGTTSTSRMLFLRFVAGNHFVLLKPNLLNTVVKPGQAANDHHYFIGSRDVATGLYDPVLVLRYVVLQVASFVTTVLWHVQGIAEHGSQRIGFRCCCVEDAGWRPGQTRNFVGDFRATGKGSARHCSVRIHELTEEAT